MKANCLPFASIPHTSPLFLDFLHHFEKVREFYARPPAFSSWWTEELERIRLPQSRRAQVAAVLERQNRRFGAGTRTLENIQRLKNGAPAVVTGQQVVLFGGPMFVVLKALTALLLAEKAGAVPVFWLATEDHDLDEVNLVHLPAADHLETFTTTVSAHPEGAPVGTIAFHDEILGLLRRLEEQFGGSEMLSVLQQSYRPGETFGSAFAKLYTQAFAESGIVFLDPWDAELHQIAAPIYRDALLKSGEIHDALITRQQELERAGYEAQVKVTPSHTLCFYLQEGARMPVRQAASEGGGFVIGEQKITQADLISDAERHPERFSANVLLRPIMQDYLLPTLAYIGGPAEIAYFAQVEVVYRLLLGRVTPVAPRISATVIEPRSAKLLQRYQMELPDLFRGAEKLREYVAAKALPESIMKSFDAAAEHLEQAIALIAGPLEKLDPTLHDAAENAASKMRYQVQGLRDKAARAEARKNTETQRHADELSTLLYPNKNLQEREAGASYFLLKYGSGILQQLREKLSIACLDHQVVELEKA